MRRTFAMVAAVIEVGLLLWLANASPFQVRSVTVTGTRELNPGQVLRLSGLQHPGSVFAIDAATIRRKLSASPWVRDATITTQLPDRVTVAVDEWVPVAEYVPGGGTPSAGHGYYLSDQARVLGVAPAPDAVLEVDGPPGAALHAGQRPLDLRLLTALVNIQRGLPSTIGQEVKSFAVDACGNLTMTVVRGWKVYFGRVITPEEFAALKDKLAALKAIATVQNLNSPDLQYINVMNPQLPAVSVKGKPSPTPKPGSSPAPTPAPTPGVC
ncbi:MAG TPA: FtsQ-type POTRA domain-containing protein [Candidatus Dormibacteraeota bacterium]